MEENKPSSQYDKKKKKEKKNMFKHLPRVKNVFVVFNLGAPRDCIKNCKTETINRMSRRGYRFHLNNEPELSLKIKEREHISRTANELYMNAPVNPQMQSARGAPVARL